MLKTLNSFFNVNAEQKRLLKRYVFQIKKHQPKINFIGKSTVNQIWVRHIIDSMQIINVLPIEKKGKFLLDVGTGAGFPGVILYIMGRKDVLLCDKSSKKVHFLKKMLQECSLNIEVHNSRIESFFKDNIAVIVSRAFSPIKKLLSSIYHLVKKDTVLVIHKGKKYREEIEEAKKFFVFKFQKFQSVTSKEGVILKIKSIKKI
ncbi:16S rRNA (guanine(527)-N(7))-methyltransferase RsmG [Alphaproteobacteria bacterium]|nr:16S rRNA (guanine(527)-N(7))-methyltransferase RsmG [Alphaproteobacteria bacterium]